MTHRSSIFGPLLRLLARAHRLLRPPPPAPDPALPRLAELARLFRVAHPDAGAEDWEAFAVDLALAARREGEERGYDRARGLDEGALRARHDWVASASRPEVREALARLEAPGDPLAGLSPEARGRLHALLAAGFGFEWARREAAEDPGRGE